MKDDVLIKSNKYGITIYFNSDNSFEELLDDVKNKFQSAAKFFAKKHFLSGWITTSAPRFMSVPLRNGKSLKS